MLTRLKGIAASSGLCMGHAILMQEAVDLRRVGRGITANEVAGEISRVTSAIEVAVAELADLETKAEVRVGAEEAAIFSAQALMLQDSGLIEAIDEAITGNLVSAEKAVLSAIEEQARLLDSLDDKYLAERATDVRDVGRRVVRILVGVTARSIPSDLEPGTVIVADDLTPSETVMMDASKVVGLVLDKGGATSHTAILARTLGIPAVVGCGNATAAIADGYEVFLDGDSGMVYVGPDASEREAFSKRVDAWIENKHRLSLLKDLPAITKDGRRIELAANIGGLVDADAAKKAGAEGVGLFRTEFLFVKRDSLPTEQEQFEVYRDVLAAMAPSPVVIRTLDAGGDKEITYLNLPEEENPFLGLRAIRLCLQERRIFHTQLRALLRASVHGNLRIMFPMVACIAELRQAKAAYEAARQELIAASIPISEGIQVGIMVEVPSAAVDADILAPECDFFSIGTNDLVQYTMACDRGNPSVTYLSDPFYPAVLRLIRKTIEEGKKAGIWVGMCGEMAGMPLAIPLLIGMGIDEISMAAGSIPRAKEIVRGIDAVQAEAIWEDVKLMGTNIEIREYLKKYV